MLPLAEDFSPNEVMIEPKLGGRIVGRYHNNRGLEEGIIFATVIGIRRPAFLELSLLFPLAGNVSFTLTASGPHTEINITPRLSAIPSNAPGIAEIMKLVIDEFLNRLKTVSELAATPISIEALSNALPPSNDPEIDLEAAYQELQASLIHLRQEVATAIANEKQLEAQKIKNDEQAGIWLNRADMARGQGNEDLANQSIQRREAYVKASEDLTSYIAKQKTVTSQMRELLNEKEKEVQDVYTKKQVLIARQKTLDSVEKVDEALNSVRTGARDLFAKIEEELEKREAAVGINYPKSES